MGSKKLSKRGPKMRAFCMLKTFKSVVRYCKIKVLRGSEKYQKYDEKWLPKWIQKVCKMDPLAAQGRPRGDFVTPAQAVWAQARSGRRGGASFEAP